MSESQQRETIGIDSLQRLFIVAMIDVGEFFRMLCSWQQEQLFRQGVQLRFMG